MSSSRLKLGLRFLGFRVWGLGFVSAILHNNTSLVHVPVGFLPDMLPCIPRFMQDSVLEIVCPEYV